MLTALTIGILTAATVTLAVAVFSRSSTRAYCPECAGATKIVLLPPILRRNEFVHLRWCPSCQWQGLGRNGPEWVQGRQLAHDSGFHWGDERFETDFGFKFRRMQQSTELPPHHPSGFRFTDEPEVAPAAPQHPSGFRFSPTSPEREAVGPPIFRWAEERQGAGFAFKDPAAEPSRSKPDGFSWKGVA